MAEYIMRAEFGGSIFKILVQERQQVAQQETLLVLESMKMEIPLYSPYKGFIKEILVSEEQSVVEGQKIMVIEIE